MKKLLSAFLSLFLFVLGNFNCVLAGGVDKEEVLPDGTRLIYVSTDNINSAYARYVQKAHELMESKVSPRNNLLIKSVSIATVIGGWILSEHLENKYGKVGGKLASCMLGLVSFLYPNYVNSQADYEYSLYDYYHGFFGLTRHDNCGVWAICTQLRRCSDGSIKKFGVTPIDLNKGIVIALFYNKETGYYPNAGVREQGDQIESVIYDIINNGHKFY